MRKTSSQNLQLQNGILAAALGMTLLRFALAGQIGLGDDEAYYWDWSRRLQLSYYDHPGMVAWMIKTATVIFGQTPFAVRFFALVCNAASGGLLWILGRRMFGVETAALAVAFYLFAPIFSLGGMLMVPDAPMGLAWMAVCLLTWRILGEGEDRWPTWLLAGSLMGFGLLSKYTILLLAASFVLLMFTEADWRAYFARPRFWCAVVLAAIFCLPIVLWNVQYDWPTLKYHLHDRQTGGGGAHFARWGQFFASQALILGPALFLLCVAAWITAARRWRDRRWRFLFMMTAPAFALFALQALFAEFKPHWTAPAFSLLFIGAAELLRQGFWLASEEARRLTRRTVGFFIWLIIVPLNVLFYVGVTYPIIPKIAHLFIPASSWDPKFDPTNDLFGWPDAVRAARRLRNEALARGEPEPFLSSSRYQLVAQLAFVSQERVWRVSPGQDQYSFWQTPDDAASLVGRSSIFITDNRYERDPRNDKVFQDCEKRERVQVIRSRELARRFDVWFCRGFFGGPSR